MQIGIDSFGAVISDPATGLTLSPVQRMDNLLDEIVLADQVGLDVFGICEHHRREFGVFSSRFATTPMFTGRVGTALLSRDRLSIRVHYKILCPFGSASAALPNHSFVPARSDFR